MNYEELFLEGWKVVTITNTDGTRGGMFLFHDKCNYSHIIGPPFKRCAGCGEEVPYAYRLKLLMVPVNNRPIQ